MRTRMRRRFILTVLLAGVMIPAAPAAASIYGPIGPLADGQQATQTSQGSEIVLRRDGSHAQAFVADVGPESPASSGDGFDWGDAAIGAGAGLAAAMLVGAGTAAIRRRRSQTLDARGVATHGI
jgi:hypothetical protein